MGHAIGCTTWVRDLHDPARPTSTGSAAGWPSTSYRSTGHPIAASSSGPSPGRKGVRRLTPAFHRIETEQSRNRGSSATRPPSRGPAGVIVDTGFRGLGLGTRLAELVENLMVERGILRLLLATRDAHEVYASGAGFAPSRRPALDGDRPPPDPTGHLAALARRPAARSWSTASRPRTASWGLSSPCTGRCSSRPYRWRSSPHRIVWTLVFVVAAPSAWSPPRGPAGPGGAYTASRRRLRRTHFRSEAVAVGKLGRLHLGGQRRADVVETALGCASSTRWITVVLGVVVLQERLRRGHGGSLSAWRPSPWRGPDRGLGRPAALDRALTLAVSSGTYGLPKKTRRKPAH